MTTRRWMLLVAIAAIVLAIVGRWPRRERSVIWSGIEERLVKLPKWYDAGRP